MKPHYPIPLILILIGAILLGAVGYFLLRTQLENRRQPGAAPLPDEIVGFRLERSIIGQDAISGLNQMHAKDFPLVSGAIGKYGHQGEATLWVSRLENEATAGQMVTAMKVRITETDSPFHPLAELNIGSRMVYELEGMGQKHYYFQSGESVVWLAVDTAVAGDAIKQVLLFYP